MAKQVGFNELFNKASFDQGVNELVKLLGKITEEIELAELAGKMLSETLGRKVKQEIASLSSASKTLSKDIADITAKMDQFKATAVQVDKVTEEYRKETERLKTELEKLKQAQAGVNTETAKTTNTTKQAKQNFSMLSQSLLGVAAGAALVHRGVTIFTDQLKLAVQATIEFEHTMNQVRAVTGASAEELTVLSENANRLGASTEKTALQIANLQKELGKLGFSTTQILASTDAIVDLSTATGEDLVKSGEVAAATLKSFGMEATEMNRIVDVMVGSFNKSALDLEKFRESMKLVAPIAAATGVELEVMTASISKLADTGISGSLAGTALRNLLSSMADPSEKLTQFLGQLNSELADGVQSSDDFSLALKELKKANIDLETAVSMVDVRARSAFFTLVAQADAIEALTYEYNQLNGEAKITAEAMRTDLKTNIDIANSAFDAMRRNIVEQFNPEMIAATQFVTNLAEATRVLTNDIRSFTNQVNDSTSPLRAYLDFLKSYSAPALLKKIIESYAAGGSEKEGLANAKIGFETTKNALSELNVEMNAFSTLNDVFQNGLGAKTAGGVLSTLSNLSDEYKTFFEGVRKGELSEEGALEGIFSRLQQNLKTKKELIDIQKQVIIDADFLQKRLDVKQVKEGITEKDSADLAVALEKKRLAQLLLGQYQSQSDILDKMLKTQEKSSKEYKDTEKDERERTRNLKEQEKILLEKLKLENDLSEVSLKRAIELAQIDEKIEKDPIKRLEIQKQIYLLQIELAKLRYENEVKILDAIYKDDANILLKREQAYQNYIDNINKAGDELLLEQVNFQEEATKKLSKAVEDATKKGHENLKKLSKERLNQVGKDSQDEENIQKKKWDKIVSISQEAAQGLSQITRFVFDNQQLARENEMAAIDAWEQERIRMAGDNDEAIAAIEREAEERRKKVRIEQAKADKKEAIFQIALQTAVAVMRALSSSPPPKNFVEAAIVGAIGAAQAAVVLARPLPEFAKGTNNSPEGLAIVGERGSELIVDGKTGKTRLSPDRPSITNLSKGSQVIPAHITHKLLTDPSFDYNGVAEKHLNKAQTIKIEKESIDYNLIGAKFEQAVTKIPINQTNFDERGVTNYVVKRNVRLRRLNKRY